MTRKTALGLLAAAMTLAFAGCGSKDKTSTTATSASPTASTPKKPGQETDRKDKKGKGKGRVKVKIKMPKPNSTVGTTFKAKVKLKKFKIDAAAVGKANQKNRGHLHFSLDNGKYDFPKFSGANGVLAQKLGVQGKYSPSTKPTITYSHIPPGRHTLVVYLANNDHSNTGVQAKVSFTVR
jgi:hypothetical protein